MGSTDPLFADNAPHDLGQLFGRRCGTLGPHALKGTQLASLQEEPRHAHCPLLRRDLVGQHQSLDEGAHSVTLEALGQQIPETSGDLFKWAAVRIPIVHDLDELDGATLHNLVQHQLSGEDVRRLFPVRLEATDVVQVASAERVQKGLQVLLVLFADAPEKGALAGLRIIISKRLDKSVRGLADERLALRKQSIVVLVQPTLRVVLDLPSIMLDDEALIQARPSDTPATSSRHLQLPQHIPSSSIFVCLIHDLLAKTLVGGVADTSREILAVIVEGLEDLCDGVEHRLGIRQGEANPRQRLALVKLLFSTKHILHKVLLQALVSQVDA
mmetsp:Transcript_13465/g.33853  ORF Transcript_13465/g.33853 Transcript_13465/m.33853 type:complete len:328 (-) Transcript_13465:620-1603(-)